MIVNSAVTPFLTHINVTVAFLDYFYPHPITCPGRALNSGVSRGPTNFKIFDRVALCVPFLFVYSVHSLSWSFAMGRHRVFDDIDHVSVYNKATKKIQEPASWSLAAISARTSWINNPFMSTAAKQLNMDRLQSWERNLSTVKRANAYRKQK